MAIVSKVVELEELLDAFVLKRDLKETSFPEWGNLVLYRDQGSRCALMSFSKVKYNPLKGVKTLFLKQFW